MDKAARYEHKCIVLHIEMKNFTLTSRDALQGLTSDSEDFVRKLGEDGWELVAVLPYEATPRAALAFFKRAIS